MRSIAEDIVCRIGIACGKEPSVRLSASGGTAFYPVSDRLEASFLDGGELRRTEIRVKFKGEAPSELFAAAEKFCGDIDGIGDISGENYRVARLAPSERPSMESCGENGMSIVSFVLAAEYLLERGQDL